MNDIVQFVMGILAPHLAALKSEPANPTHGLLVRNAIEALSPLRCTCLRTRVSLVLTHACALPPPPPAAASLFQFAPADLAFSVLPPICHALSLQPLFLETAELVLVIARRRTATVSPSMHPQILKLWEVGLESSRACAIALTRVADHAEHGALDHECQVPAAARVSRQGECLRVAA